MLSKKAIDLIIQFEIGGRTFYDKALQKPTYPGGESGVTIGIGYDLGYNTEKQFMADWSPSLNLNFVNALRPLCGLKGEKVKGLLRGEVLNVRIPYNIAYDVFVRTSVPRYYKATLSIYPQLAELNEDTQGALVSMIYNRGTSLNGERRKEMRNIVALVANKDYEGIAEEIENSKRLWEHKGMDGLVLRREAEADLIRDSI
jgi:GH24 family phage-related lysozyme (muramidase)